MKNIRIAYAVRLDDRTRANRTANVRYVAAFTFGTMNSGSITMHTFCLLLLLLLLLCSFRVQYVSGDGVNVFYLGQLNERGDNGDLTVIFRSSTRRPLSFRRRSRAPLKAFVCVPFTPVCTITGSRAFDFAGLDALRESREYCFTSSLISSSVCT